jgi:hypothetical protein
MALHQYLCPECGVALQSAQDVAGRPVRCLGCQAVFTARPAGRTAPEPKAGSEEPKAVRPKRSIRRDPDEPSEPELPPIPRDRKAASLLVVFGGAGAIAVTLTIVLVVRYRDRKADPAAPSVVNADAPAKAVPPPVLTRPPGAPRPGDDTAPSGRQEQEEDTAAVATKAPRKGPPDLGGILPNVPGLTPRGHRPGPAEAAGPRPA